MSHLRIVHLIFSLIFLSCNITFAQELNATVEINTQKIEGTNKSVFENLKTTLTEFINDRQWTSLTVLPQERIKCSFTIIVNKYTEANGLFECEAYIQSSRPVFNAAYTTTTFQHRDKKFNFNFQEFDQLNYDDEHINNSLTALIAYYCYMIIGIDMDTMSPLGGKELLQKAMHIADNAQNMDVTGWKALEDLTNRYGIINDLVSEGMTPLRQLQYEYHRNGLDQMAEKTEESRNTILAAIVKQLQQAHSNKPLSKLPQYWTETKRDELVGIFKGQGTQKQKQGLYDLLVKLNASQSTFWKDILK